MTDAGVELSSAQFGAFFYNIVRPDGEAYTLYTLSGAPREAFEQFPIPRNTELFEPTFRGTGVVRSPDILADPALAVAKRVPGIAWPIGTGAYWVSGATADLTAAPVGGARRPVLRWRPAGGDQRDLLDAGVDLLVTDDPGAVAYAATRADFSSVPLPWDRTYVLLAPVPVRAPAPILEDLARGLAAKLAELGGS